MIVKGKQGFASMSPEKHREIARQGGLAAKAKGNAHKFTSELGKEAGHKGAARLRELLGEEQYREHMRTIGTKGGQTIASRPGHMRTIGIMGGASYAATHARKSG